MSYQQMLDKQAQDAQAALGQLLDFSSPFPVQLFDNMVRTFQQTGNPGIDTVLKQFQRHDDAWTRVPDIVQQAQYQETKVQALVILEDLVKTRWNTLGAPEREGIKNFIITLILQISQSSESLKEQKLVLGRLQSVLIAIVKCEWPHNWPSFITDIVTSAKNSESVCTSNMQILLLLSEEVFDYGKTQMTQQKVLTLKTQLNADFQQIFDLCSFVLTNSQDAILITTTLRALLRFLRWIPLEFILNTQLVPTLALRFFPDPLYRSHTIQCLNEIACLEYASKYGNQFDGLYTSMLTSVLEHVYSKLVPEAADLNQIYNDPSASAKTRTFFTFLASFLTNFLSKHLSILENNPQSHPVLLSALAFIIRLTLIEDNELDSGNVVFVICLEFWNGFLKDIYRTEQPTIQQQHGVNLLSSNNQFGQGFNQTTLNLGGAGSTQQTSRLQLYHATLGNLTQVMLVRMVRPDEVLIVVDENGNADRVRLDTTETTSNYNLMRETFAFLTFLDSKRILDTMYDQTNEVTRTIQNDWKPHRLNRLCWAIGSIQRALNETQEKKLLATILRPLLQLVDQRPSKDDKAIVAANIMHVVAQYPRFLRQNYSFLVTVVDKLFQFMHELHPGVQDMAVDTFLAIAQKCKRTLVVQPSDDEQLPQRHQNGPRQPYVFSILTNIQDHTRSLQKQHLYTFYEAVATIISSEQDIQVRDNMLFQLMKIPNEEWVVIVQQAHHGNLEILRQLDTIRRLETCLKINTRVASAVTTIPQPTGPNIGGFLTQMSRLFLEMLVVYRMYSSYISEQIQQNGENVLRVEVLRYMSSVRKEMLILLTTFVRTASQQESQAIQQRFLPELINTIVQDYVNIAQLGRDPEVLSLFAALISLLKRGLSAETMMQIFINLFPATLPIITTGTFGDYPDHRRCLYSFLQVSVEFHLPVLFNLQPNEFQLVIDCILWGIKHLTRDIQEHSLSTLESILLQIQQPPSGNQTNLTQFANTFYQSFIFTILEGVLSVLTDTFHRSSFNRHTSILALIFNCIQSNKIAVGLQEPAPPATADPTIIQQYQLNQQQLLQSGGTSAMNNLTVIKQYIARLLIQGFNTVTQSQVETFVNSLLESCNSATKFRNHVTNFLIELKEFSVHSIDLEQQQQQLQQQQLKEQQQQM